MGTVFYLAQLLFAWTIGSAVTTVGGFWHAVLTGKMPADIGWQALQADQTGSNTRRYLRLALRA